MASLVSSIVREKTDIHHLAKEKLKEEDKLMEMIDSKAFKDDDLVNSLAKVHFYGRSIKEASNLESMSYPFLHHAIGELNFPAIELLVRQGESLSRVYASHTPLEFLKVSLAHRPNVLSKEEAAELHTLLTEK